MQHIFLLLQCNCSIPKTQPRLSTDDLKLWYIVDSITIDAASFNTQYQREEEEVSHYKYKTIECVRTRESPSRQQHTSEVTH